MIATASTTAAQARAATPEPTTSAADGLFDAFGGVFAWAQGFTLTEVSINAGLSVLALAVAVTLLWLGRRLAGLALRRLTDGQNQPRAAEATWALVKLAALIGATLVVLRVWGLDPVAWAAAGDGAAASRTAIRVVLLTVVFVLAVEVGGVLVDRLMGRAAARARDPRRTAQVQTIAPLLKAVLRTVLVVMGALMLLSEFGVQIGPLLAGAGVLGIAIGFGAQTLVKDLLTGVYLVMEDTVSLNDVVRIGDVSGVVESMTLRTIRLRDYDGTLHVIPYGEAQIIHNKTKTFSRYVFNISVAYEADIDLALDVMRRVGAELRGDPRLGPRILDDLEVVGVDQLADSGVILKARIKTEPGQQWVVGREYQRRIKMAFDAQGIEIPFPHLKLVLPSPPVAEPAAAGA